MAAPGRFSIVHSLHEGSGESTDFSEYQALVDGKQLPALDRRVSTEAGGFAIWGPVVDQELRGILADVP
jgi:hypothetical protein